MESAPRRSLVTVLITVHNRTNYLKIALESVLRQSYEDLEVLVINDGGPGEIDRIVADCRDPRVRYIRHVRNLRPPTTFFRAFEEARGDYFAFLSDDDLWEPDFVARMVDVLDRDPEVAIAFSDHSLMDAEGRIHEETSDANSRLWGRADLAPGLHRPFYDLAVRSTLPVGMAAVFRRSAVAWDDFPIEVGICYDLWMGCLLARDGMGAWYIPERLTRYRFHQNSQTSLSRTIRSQVELYIFDRILADPRFDSCRELTLNRRAVVEAQYGYDLLQQGKGPEARHHLRTAWKTIRSPKIAAAWLLSFCPAAIAQFFGRLKRRRAGFGGEAAS